MVWERWGFARTRRVRRAALAGLALACIATPVSAQLFPPHRTTTTTAPPATQPPPTTGADPPPTDPATTTTLVDVPPLGDPPPDQQPPPADGSDPAPPAASDEPPPGADGAAPVVDEEGDDSGLSPLGGGPGQVVPPEAASYIARLRRSAPNDNRVLVETEQTLLAAGHDPDEAARLAYGHFPVAGPAHWADDWLAPRFTGTEFRYHYGIDLIAPYGTPLRSPADGRALIQQGALGGLTVEVVLPDGTFYELAHLSGLAPGIATGVPLHTGDLLGFVGTSGDASGPHCHFGLWVHGSTPASPKSQLDQWVAEAAANAQSVLAPVRAGMRPTLGTSVTRSLVEDSSGSEPRSVSPASADLLLASAGSPSGGALRVAEATVSRLAGDVDWSARSVDSDTTRDATHVVSQSVAQMLHVLAGQV